MNFNSVSLIIVTYCLLSGFSQLNSSINFNQYSLLDTNNYTFCFYLEKSVGRLISIEDIYGNIFSLLCETSGIYKMYLNSRYTQKSSICNIGYKTYTFIIMTSPKNITLLINNKKHDHVINMTSTYSEEKHKNDFAKFAIGNAEFINSPKESKIKGCFFNFTINGAAELNITKDGIDPCKKTNCHQGRVERQYTSEVYCNCSFAPKKGKYCNKELEKFKSPRSFINTKNQTTTVIATLKSATVGNYCLISIKDDISEFDVYVEDSETIVAKEKTKLGQNKKANISNFESHETYIIILQLTSNKLKVQCYNRSKWTTFTNIKNITMSIGKTLSAINCIPFEGWMHIEYDSSKFRDISTKIPKKDAKTHSEEVKNNTLGYTIFIVILVLIVIGLIIAYYTYKRHHIFPVQSTELASLGPSSSRDLPLDKHKMVNDNWNKKSESNQSYFSTRTDSTYAQISDTGEYDYLPLETIYYSIE